MLNKDSKFGYQIRFSQVMNYYLKKTTTRIGKLECNEKKNSLDINAKK
ncbi:hypothetical protein HMPREF9515_00889 [Enterococcus faecalis TX0860]|nr:hypothetical protein HMPREF9515_00889 [Enterococcus faecalis TX0860]